MAYFYPEPCTDIASKFGFYFNEIIYGGHLENSVQASIIDVRRDSIRVFWCYCSKKSMPTSKCNVKMLCPLLTHLFH